ncbi:threonine synthase [Natrialbaceae archaeon AArc-T1-2]|uniref:threonine synthase n=1 Tax=Natrialbaceae archaeon AArc-T1-2 TaxID=3053904 RepID=UPI00255B10C3|nr:threonine synthase [Natrialbaceae archaeon AArc-T1-2]WIV68098.1 threonine synthase [Natrialbaceae archaeon AArc-T1-2]
METNETLLDLECIDCGETVDAETAAARCPECGGILDPVYDYDAIDLDRETLASRPRDSMWRYEELLPFARERAVTTNEGATPLVDCGGLAAELGVERVLFKDEGRNPTGSIRDREAAVAVTAAAEAGVDDVALPAAGDAGQAVTAYAGRADLEAHVYLPSRASHTTKSMVNVHGGEMTVVGGRFPDAAGAYEEALAEHDGWEPLSAFDTPYRHEGAKTILFELLEDLEWTTPDAVVVPAGDGVALAGLYKAGTELLELGLIDEIPPLYAAQAEGCAPIVEAFDVDAEAHEPIDHPDTICGEIEIPDPAGGALVLEALRATDGGAVATDDDAILEAGIAVAKGEGLEMAPSAAAAASGTWELGERGTFDGDETVVVLNTGAGNKESDVLRSHLMGKGI